jgi:hypothetical protein
MGILIVIFLTWAVISALAHAVSPCQYCAQRWNSTHRHQ